MGVDLFPPVPTLDKCQRRLVMKDPGVFFFSLIETRVVRGHYIC